MRGGAEVGRAGSRRLGATCIAAMANGFSTVNTMTQSCNTSVDALPSLYIQLACNTRASQCRSEIGKIGCSAADGVSLYLKEACALGSHPVGSIDFLENRPIALYVQLYHLTVQLYPGPGC